MVYLPFSTQDRFCSYTEFYQGLLSWKVPMYEIQCRNIVMVQQQHYLESRGFDLESARLIV